jgi:hypothetical protein
MTGLEEKKRDERCIWGRDRGLERERASGVGSEVSGGWNIEGVADGIKVRGVLIFIK